MKTAPKKTMPLDYVTRMSEAIKVIGHAQRIQILEHLDLADEATVTQIVEAVSGSQGAISQHLGKMRTAGLITCRRDNKHVYYRIKADSVRTILGCMRKNAPA